MVKRQTAFAMREIGGMVSSLRILQPMNERPHLTWRRWQHRAEQEHHLRQGQRGRFFFIFKATRTRKKWARITRVRW